FPPPRDLHVLEGEPWGLGRGVNSARPFHDHHDRDLLRRARQARHLGEVRQAPPAARGRMIMTLADMPPPTQPTFVSLSLNRADWPQRDRKLYEAALKSPFRLPNAKKRLAELSPSTRATDEHGYGTWLGFLTQAGGLSSEVEPAARIDEDRVGQYVGTLDAT